jgi:hypothetical protein
MSLTSPLPHSSRINTVYQFVSDEALTADHSMSEAGGDYDHEEDIDL